MGHGCNIVSSDQFGDPETRRFFMRIGFSGEAELEVLRSAFAAVAGEYSMNWQLYPTDYKPKVLIMVSQYEHYLADCCIERASATCPSKSCWSYRITPPPATW